MASTPTTTSTPASPGQQQRRPSTFATRHVAPRRRSSRVLVLQVLIGVVFLGLWQFASAVGLLNPLLYSHPLAIVSKLLAYLSGEAVYSRTIYDHLKVTVQEMAIGYAL